MAGSARLRLDFFRQPGVVSEVHLLLAVSVRTGFWIRRAALVLGTLCNVRGHDNDEGTAKPFPRRSHDPECSAVLVHERSETQLR